MTDKPTPENAAPRKAADSPRWCERCQKYGDHHTDRCPMPDPSSEPDTAATVYLLELVEDHGGSSQHQVFASLEGAQASLDSDVTWKHYPDDEGRYWSGDVPGDMDNVWWITRLEVKP